MAEGIRPNGGPFIPLSEIEMKTSRSSGPGGQHANVTASRVEAVFDVTASNSLSPALKDRIIRKAGPVVRAVSQDARSQTRNRALALERLEGKLTEALRVPRRRRPTRPGRAAREKRLESKRQRSRIKRQRRRPTGEE